MRPMTSIRRLFMPAPGSTLGAQGSAGALRLVDRNSLPRGDLAADIEHEPVTRLHP